MESESDAKRVTLRLREVLDEVKDRQAQLLDRGVRKLHFRLDPGRPDNPERSTGVDRVLEQGSLSDACFAMHDQHATARIIEQAVQRLALTFAPEQLSP